MARLELEQGGVVTVVGGLAGVPAGAVLRVTRPVRDHRAFRRAVSYRRATPRWRPQTLEGMRRYLGSGLIKGIGPEFAARIVDRFGIETLEILDRDPGRISEVPGIGPTRARAIRSAWSAQREVRKVMVFLQGYGVSPAFAARIYKRYGAAAIVRVRENPYRLAFDIWGIGFLSADRLAAALGIARDAPERARGGRAPRAGRGGRERARLRAARAARASRGGDARATRGAVGAAIDRLARAGDVAVDASVVGDRGRAAVYDVGLYRAETALAVGLDRLARDAARRPPRIDEERALAWYERSAGIALARQQAEAVKLALAGQGRGDHRRPRRRQDDDRARHRLDPGPQEGSRVALAAPTGRAAKRLSDATGQPASTLHRLLEWRPADGAFGRGPERPLEADVADRRRGLDAGRAAGRGAGGGAAPRHAAGAGGRRRSAPLGRPGDGAARRDRERAPFRPCGSPRSSARRPRA